MSITKDIFVILRPLLIILVFQLVIAVALIGTTEGHDMIILLLEDFQKQYGSILFYAVALFFWSIVSEFGSRFILYLSDISSHHLKPERVKRRAKIADIISRCMLAGPVVITTLALIVTMSDGETTGLVRHFLLALLTLGLIALLLYHLYFGKWKHRISFTHRLPSPSQKQIIRLTGILQETYEEAPIGVTVLPDPQHQEWVESTDPNKRLIKTKFTQTDFEPLFRRFKLLLLIAIVIIALFAVFFSDRVYVSVGALAIMPLSFASWLIVYYAIEYADKVQPFKIKAPYKVLTGLLILVVSCLDNDHPVRVQQSSARPDSMPSLQTHFKYWLKNKEINTSKPFPVVFVAAEGGALRTGFFSAAMLAHIQENYPDVSDRMYAFSSVSGGTLGVNHYAALKTLNTSDSIVVQKTNQFFQHDFLSVATGRLLFGEIINYAWPVRIEHFDRAIGLEKSWEMAFEETNQDSLLSQPFHQIYRPDSQRVYSAMFINTTEVETGKRAIYANVKIDTAIFPTTRDLYAFANKPLAYSTAIGLSARFPIVSPAAAVTGTCKPYHYVDGGYYENRGATTMFEVITHLKSLDEFKNMIPYLIVFSFGESAEKMGDYHAFEELTSIVKAIYNVRSGHTEYATDRVEKFVRKNHGDTGLNVLKIAPKKEVPMNWVFSQRTIAEVEKQCKELVLKNKAFFDRVKSKIDNSNK